MAEDVMDAAASPEVSVDTSRFVVEVREVDPVDDRGVTWRQIGIVEMARYRAEAALKCALGLEDGGAIATDVEIAPARYRVLEHGEYAVSLTVFDVDVQRKLDVQQVERANLVT